MGNIKSCFSPKDKAVVITPDGVHHLAQLPMDRAEASDIFAPGEHFLGDVDGIVCSGYTPAPLLGRSQLQPGGVYVFIPREKMERFFPQPGQIFYERQKLNQEQIDILKIILERVRKTRGKKSRVGFELVPTAEIIWG